MAAKHRKTTTPQHHNIHRTPTKRLWQHYQSLDHIHEEQESNAHSSSQKINHLKFRIVGPILEQEVFRLEIPAIGGSAAVRRAPIQQRGGGG